MKYQFPENFWWGSAASGPQTEGVFEGDGKGQNIWDFGIKKRQKNFFNKSVQIRPHNFIKIPRRYSVNERNGT